MAPAKVNGQESHKKLIKLQAEAENNQVNHQIPALSFEPQQIQQIQHHNMGPIGDPFTKMKKPCEVGSPAEKAKPMGRRPWNTWRNHPRFLNKKNPLRQGTIGFLL